jgi:predicted NBD/HSP70 family sugar kinase
MARTRTQDEVFDFIVRGQSMTRPELMRLTGMSRSTVNNAVARLLAEGRIEESSTVARGRGAGSGRPATQLVPSSEGSPVAAIDFGHNHIRVAIADPVGNVIDETHALVEVDSSAMDSMDAAAGMLEALCSRHDVTRLASVAAGIPGPVDTVSGRVRSRAILAGWVDLDPQGELSRRLRSPVTVENDALLGAMGELRSGAGRGYANFLYVKASHGIGAGIVVDGRPFRGAHGLAGEIGHSKLPGRSELCRCGDRGCLESVVSLAEVHRQAQHAHPHLRVDADLFAEPDHVTTRIVEEAGRTLGSAIASYCDLLDPSAIVIGGLLPTFGSAFVDGVEDGLRHAIQPATAESIVVLPAQLGDRSEILGAVDLALSRAYAG